ncbi:MAG: class D sortase [Steroidobacteraceae bacterium]
MERILWAAALACWLPFLSAVAARAWFDADSIAQLAAKNPERSEPGVVIHEFGKRKASPVTHEDWSAQRLSAFREYVASAVPQPVATLEFLARDARIPVFRGVSELTMTIGAGHLPDSAALDGSGNVALTAHRDGAFRRLRKIEAGELLALRVGTLVRIYKVREHRVVEPTDLSVLTNTIEPTLTLITCYPFWFVGKAPRRFIIQADLIREAQANESYGVHLTTHLTGGI